MALDYHEWNDHENEAWHKFLTENHRTGREFAEANKPTLLLRATPLDVGLLKYSSLLAGLSLRKFVEFLKLRLSKPKVA